MKRQWTQEEKAKRADYVITNNGSPSELRQRAAEIYKKINP